MNSKKINELKNSSLKYIFTDFDDTISTEGKLLASSYLKLEELKKAGYKVIIVTGRPAGFCDFFARFFPVDAVIGENGAFYYLFKENKLQKFYFTPESQRLKNKVLLQQTEKLIYKAVPAAKRASDQEFRVADIAIDWCEDIPELSKDEIKQIIDILKKQGLNYKVSSIHINAWIGEYNKLSMTQKYLKDQFNLQDKNKILESSCFCGDSPNDEPMFNFFEYSVGVNNVLDFKDTIKTPPKYICHSRGGKGFEELADQLLNLKK